MIVRFGEWQISEWPMGNGENSTLLLFQNYYSNSSSTLSVFHYPGALLNSNHSPPQPARAPPNPVSGCKPWRRLDAYGNKRVNGGLVNGEWWKLEHFTLSESKCKFDQHTISFQLSIIHYSVINYPLFSYPFIIHHSPKVVAKQLGRKSITPK